MVSAVAAPAPQVTWKVPLTAAVMLMPSALMVEALGTVTVIVAAVTDTILMMSLVLPVLRTTLPDAVKVDTLVGVTLRYAVMPLAVYEAKSLARPLLYSAKGMMLNTPVDVP